MNSETYTPGHTDHAVSFMSQRSLESHGGFFAPYIEPSHVILDAGCGPGSISLGLAAAASSGRVHGVDFGESQVAAARTNAAEAGITNVEFAAGSCYELPFADNSFDRVFCHALMEHLARPVDAMKEFTRVLKPGGVAGVCSPDFDGTLLAPASDAVTSALDAYASLQKSNGGDLRIGKKLGSYLGAAGFVDISQSARYECYPSLDFIGEYLAKQLDAAHLSEHAARFRNWMQQPAGLFAQCWVSAVGVKPTRLAQPDA